MGAFSLRKGHFAFMPSRYFNLNPSPTLAPASGVAIASTFLKWGQGDHPLACGAP